MIEFVESKLVIFPIKVISIPCQNSCFPKKIMAWRFQCSRATSSQDDLAQVLEQQQQAGLVSSDYDLFNSLALQCCLDLHRESCWV